MDDVVDWMASESRRCHDRRGVFLTSYVLITLEMRRRVRAGRFCDAAWVERYLCAFADLYRAAWDSAAPPAPWKVAFLAAERPDATMLQVLLVGINAHINHDLPLALLRVGIDPDRASRRSDHVAVNLALSTTTPLVQDVLCADFSVRLRRTMRWTRPLHSRAASLAFAHYREGAWRAATRLVDGTPAQRPLMIDELSSYAVIRGQKLMAFTDERLTVGRVTNWIRGGRHVAA